MTDTASYNDAPTSRKEDFEYTIPIGMRARDNSRELENGRRHLNLHARAAIYATSSSIYSAMSVSPSCRGELPWDVEGTRVVPTQL